jgi:hypothetical protein
MSNGQPHDLVLQGPASVYLIHDERADIQRTHMGPVKGQVTISGSWVHVQGDNESTTYALHAVRRVVWDQPPAPQ